MNRPTPDAPWYRYWERAPAAAPAAQKGADEPAGASAPAPPAGDDAGAAPKEGEWFHVERGPLGVPEDPTAHRDREGSALRHVEPDDTVSGAAPQAQGAPPFHVEPSAGDREGSALRHAEPDDTVSGAAPQVQDAPPFHVEPEASERPAAPASEGDRDSVADRAPQGGHPAAWHGQREGGGADAVPPARDTSAVDAEPDDSVPEDAPQARDTAVQSDAGRPAGASPSDHASPFAPAGSLEDVVAPGDLSPHFDRARVLTIANQKGGVGKTTTAVSVSAALAELGSRVLLVDLDPQGNATSGVGVKVGPNHPTIYDVLVGGVDLEDAIEPTSVRNLFVVPANLDLAGAEIELVSAFSREQKLRNALEPIRSEYDIVLVDCPPSLGLLTVNALSAGDGLLVPIQCEYYALEGLGALRRNADLIRSQLNPDLDITGFVLTMLDARTRLSQQVVDEVRAHFGDKVFNSRIPRSVRLAEAPGFGQPITVFDPGSRGSMAYRRLAAELLQRLITNGPPPDRRTEGAPA